MCNGKIEGRDFATTLERFDQYFKYDKELSEPKVKNLKNEEKDTKKWDDEQY